MSNVGYATLTVLPSAKGFASALQKETNPAMGRAGAVGGAALGGGLLASMKGLAGPLAAAVGVSTITSAFGSAIKEASNLGESVNAVNVVFGDAAGGVLDLGKKAAQSLGLSNVEFNGLAVQFSNFAKTVAGPGGNVTSTLQELTGRAADFASVMNLDVAEAATLFQSGLAGETEPLRKFGIDLSAAAVEAFAYANGIAEGGKELTEAEKVQARYGLLMESTAQTAGDFANTQDSLANVQRRLSSSWSDLQAKIGVLFLPVLEKLLGFVNASVIPGLSKLIDVVGAVGSVLVNGDFNGAIAEALGVPEDAPLIDFLFTVRETIESVFGSIATAFAPFAPKIAAAFSSLGGEVLGLLPMLSPLGLIFQALQPVLPQIASVVGLLAVSLGTLLGSALTTLAPLLQTVVGVLSESFIAIMPAVLQVVSAFSTVLLAIVPVVGTLLAAIAPLITSLLESLAPILVTLVTTILPVVASLFGLVAQAIGPLVEVIVAVLMPVIQALLPVVEVVFGVIAAVVTAAMTIIQGIIQVVSSAISGDWDGVWAGIGQILVGAWDLIVSVITGALAILGSLFVALGSVISTRWNQLWSFVGSFFAGVWQGVVSGVSTGIRNVVGFFTGLPGQVLGALSGLGSFLLNVGADMMRGFIQGVVRVGRGIAEAVLAPIRGAVDGVKEFLGIRSPSRLLMAIGGDTAEGMAIGLRRGAGLVQAASEALVPALPSVPSPTSAVARSTPQSGAQSSSAGAFVNHGVIQVTDERALIAEVEKQKRRSLTAAGIQRGQVA